MNYGKRRKRVSNQDSMFRVYCDSITSISGDMGRLPVNGSAFYGFDAGKLVMNKPVCKRVFRWWKPWTWFNKYGWEVEYRFEVNQ
jgi:hypothetical protein